MGHRIVSLRLTIGALSAVAVAIVGCATLGITLSSSFSSIREVGQRHVDALLAKADEEVTGLFAQASDPVTEVLNLVAGEAWPHPSDDPTTYEVWNAVLKGTYVRAPKQIGAVYFFFADNTRIALVRDPAVPSVYAMSNTRSSSVSRDYPNQRLTADVRAYDAMTHARLDAADPRIRQLPQPPLGYVNGSDSWDLWSLGTSYSFAVTMRATAVRTGSSNVTLAAVITAPLFALGTTRGVKSQQYAFLILHFAFDRLSDCLRGVKSTPGTNAFAYDSAGYLLGTSEPQGFLTEMASRTGTLPAGCASTGNLTFTSGAAPISHLCRAKTQEYPNAVLQSIARDHPDVHFPSSSLATRIEAAGEPHYVGSTRIQFAFRGLDVIVLLVMPERDVVGNIMRDRDIGIAITAALIVAVVLVDVVLVWLLLAPLTTMAGRMLKAANLEDDDEDKTVSAMAEVAELQEAYYAMNDELKAIRSFVPQTVLMARKQEREAKIAFDDDMDGDLEYSIGDMSASSLPDSPSSPRPGAPDAPPPPSYKCAAAGSPRATTPRGGVWGGRMGS
jgi:hypothetical protein